MDILKLGADLIGKELNLGPDVSPDHLMGALSGLLGQGPDGGIDLPGLMSKMEGLGLGNLLASFLGDGANGPMSPEAVTDVLGADKVDAFANALDIHPDHAAEGLSTALPQLIDRLSSGGSLLSGLTGGQGGLMGIAKSFFG